MSLATDRASFIQDVLSKAKTHLEKTGSVPAIAYVKTPDELCVIIVGEKINDKLALAEDIRQFAKDKGAQEIWMVYEAFMLQETSVEELVQAGYNKIAEHPDARSVILLTGETYDGDFLCTAKIVGVEGAKTISEPEAKMIQGGLGGVLSGMLPPRTVH